MRGFWGNLWQVILDCNLLNLVGGFAILLIVCYAVQKTYF